MCLNLVKPETKMMLCHLQLNFIKMRQSHINSWCWTVVSDRELRPDVMLSGAPADPWTPHSAHYSFTASPFLRSVQPAVPKPPTTAGAAHTSTGPFSALASHASHRLQILFASWVTAVLNKGNCGFDPGLLTFRAASGYRSNKPNCPCCGNLAKIRPL